MESQSLEQIQVMNDLPSLSGLITLDDWSDEEIDSMIEIGGNSSANSTYDTFIPVGITKLGADSSHERSSKFIRA